VPEQVLAGLGGALAAATPALRAGLPPDPPARCHNDPMTFASANGGRAAAWTTLGGPPTALRAHALSWIAVSADAGVLRRGGEAARAAPAPPSCA